MTSLPSLLSRRGRVAVARRRTVAPTISDSFNRADSSTSLGTTDTGQTWLANVSTFGISSNQAYNSGTNGVATVDVGSATQDISVKAAVGVSGPAGTPQDAGWGIVARATTTANDYYLLLFNGSLAFYKNVSGSFTLLSNTGVKVAAGDIIRFTLSGSTLTVYQNGVFIGSVTDSTFTSTTRAGLRAAGNSVRFDDFQVA